MMNKNKLHRGKGIIIALLLFAVFLMLQPPDKSGGKTEFHSANPNDKEFFETAYGFAGKKIDLLGKQVVAGIIPHHLLAADLIADFFYNLEGANYDTVVLIGPNHFLVGQSNLITSGYNWQTPYGVLEPDATILADLLNDTNLGMVVEEDVMQGEHSINSEVAFIKKTFPNFRIMDKQCPEKNAQSNRRKDKHRAFFNRKVNYLIKISRP